MASALLFLHGCAGPSPRPPGLDGPGRITARPGRPGFVVAAPHGARDASADEIAIEIARRTGFGLVVATDFPVPGDERPRRRYQVNRPREGRPGRPPTEDVASEGARRVYELYERRVREAAQGPLHFFAEIHANGPGACAGPIEIATVGVDRERALRLRALAELVRDAHLRSQPRVERLDVRVEPADELTDPAADAKREGILRLPPEALHIALPRCARRDFQQAYAAILGDFLGQAVLVPIPAGQ